VAEILLTALHQQQQPEVYASSSCSQLHRCMDAIDGLEAAATSNGSNGGKQLAQCWWLAACTPGEQSLIFTRLPIQAKASKPCEQSL
jgi:hypothetical protein